MKPNWRGRWAPRPSGHRHRRATRTSGRRRTAFRYGARHEEGTQTAARTIELGAGTCRDFAVLMMEALRSFGLATRFPFAFLTKTRRVPLNRTVLVYPAVEPTDEFLSLGVSLEP